MAVNYGDEITFVAQYKGKIFESETGNFRILSMSAKYDPDVFITPARRGNIPFPARGRIALPDFIGEELELCGRWAYDKRSNEPIFQISYAIPQVPKTKEDIINYLHSIPNVGEKLAERIYAFTGDDLPANVSDVQVLAASVKGLTLKKASEIKLSVDGLDSVAKLTKKLQDVIEGDVLRKISAKYGKNAFEKVSTDPYSMVKEKVVSFSQADTIALTLGWDKHDEGRIKACFISAARRLKAGSAAIIVDKTSLRTEVNNLLHIDNVYIDRVEKKMYEEYDFISAGNFCYLKEDFITERDLAKKITECVNKQVSSQDKERYLKSFDDWEISHPNVHLAENQRLAVEAVADNFLSVVTGGPGTGKTTVLKSVMETYMKTFPGSEITLMAPTGLASKRMTEACGRTAQTIHKALNLTPNDSDAGFDDSESAPINGGLVIVDEFSMVGIHLANFLFNQILYKQDTRIVIVGDIDQLPPVSPGAVLDDLIKSGVVKVTRLNRNFRQEAGSKIVDGAYDVNAGKTNLVFEDNFLFNRIEDRDIDVETKAILDDVVKEFEASIQQYGVDQTYVLCPQRKAEIKDGAITTKTLLSTTSLNPILRDIANKPSPDKNEYFRGNKKFREGDRVINLKNTSQAINGEIGHIKEIQLGSVIKIIVDFDGNLVEYTPDEFNNLDLAYCITVHKSQGCEYESVIIPMSMTQRALLARNLLYTGITRARRKCRLIGSKEAVNMCCTLVKAKSKRDLLAARLVKSVKTDI